MAAPLIGTRPVSVRVRVIIPGPLALAPAPLLPRTPAGAPTLFACTRWMMFSPSSWSPAEIHIFAPVSR